MQAGAFVFRGRGVETSPALKLNTIGSGSAAGWWVIDMQFYVGGCFSYYYWGLFFVAILVLGVGGLNLAELTLLFSAGSEVSA